MSEGLPPGPTVLTLFHAFLQRPLQPITASRWDEEDKAQDWPEGCLADLETGSGCPRVLLERKPVQPVQASGAGRRMAEQSET